MTMLGSQASARLARARAAFLELRPDGVTQRQAAIDALAAVEWKGRPLRTLRCQGETGNGPHDVHVPEALLWALIDLRSWVCPYHA